MITELLLGLPLLLSYLYGIIGLKTILLITSFIYWLPKWFFMNLVLEKYFPSVLTRRITNKPVISLTFDDIPYGSHKEIIKLLDKHNMKSTLFIISDYVKTKEDRNILVSAIRGGHQLGNHGRTNSMHALLKPSNLSNEIYYCDKLIRSLYREARTMVPKNMVYRPGCGVFTKQMLKTVKDKNYKLALGSVYPNDPIVGIPWINYLYLRFHINKGDIVIVHDRKWTPKLLTYLLPWLNKHKYKSVTLDKLMS